MIGNLDNSINALRENIERQRLALANRTSNRAARFSEVLGSLDVSLSEHFARLEALDAEPQEDAKPVQVVAVQKPPPPAPSTPSPSRDGQVIPTETFLPPRPVDPELLAALPRPLDVRSSGLGIGDIMFALPSCMDLGPVRFEISAFYPPYGWADNHPYNDEEYRRRTYHQLAEFFAYQPYIEWCGATKYGFSETYDIDYDGARRFGWGRVLKEGIDMLRVYMDYAGSSMNLAKKWLWCPEERFPQYRDHVILQFNGRAVVDYVDWGVLKPFEDRLLFLGLETEYNFWQDNGGFPIEHITADDFFQMAILMKSCHFYIGCSSAPIVFAEGLKIPRIFCRWLAQPYFRAYGNRATTIASHDEFVDALERRKVFGDVGISR